ncbi:MAG: hypothetical protein Q8Q02_01765 [Nocardioides sp.]|nr:hypothetical protein [Nocardioides sp.]
MSRSLRTPVLAALAVLALVVGAYGLGTLFPEGGSEDRPAARESAGPRADPTAVSADDGMGIGDVEASCIDAPSQDASGRPVSYEPELVADGDPATAWRCSGDGRGASLRILLDETRTISEVGLIPGYAKTDAVDGSDRYAQNRRIARVRWIFPDGTRIAQDLSTDPGNRSVQTVPVPDVDADQVTLEILESSTGERDSVAISEVLLR